MINTQNLDPRLLKDQRGRGSGYYLVSVFFYPIYLTNAKYRSHSRLN
ncbi:MAG: hypothetical protein RLZZ507_894 [Cyanobacteriota bacterium]|jgi:hypothetical protein